LRASEQGGKGVTRRMGRGLTEYVLRTRKPLLVSRAEADELIAFTQKLRAATLEWLQQTHPALAPVIKK